ncbi:GTPase-activating protein [Diatrype stigma]|uniref:GTPase-activating protein n=1 Tax=Diatrype stigma TaxID=117547 RepID=A0AAN9UZB2_9PEZI
MEFHMQSTIFGQLVRFLSRGKFFKYPDEIDPSLWKKAVQRDTPENTNATSTPADLSKKEAVIQDNETRDQTVDGCVVGQNIILVGWYGEDDTEMPKLGRSGIFFWTLLAFILFQLPVGFAPNIAVFLVFRWVTGFCGSPCLSTGGGTIMDIYAPTTVPYLFCIWSSAGVLGPVFGPIVGGYLAPAMGWRWTIWAFTCLCSLVLIIMFFLLPETSAANILYNRAKRLRKATGNRRLRSQSEIDSAQHKMKDNFLMLARAFTLTFFEPIVLLMDLYCGLLYGILFIWFESFPLVFGGIYGFNSGQQGLVFIGILVFAMISVPLFLLWIKLRLLPKMMSGNFKPEMFLPPTFIGCFALPICLFWFGWTAREDIHWIVPIIGSGFFSVGVVTLFNSLFNYLGITYSKNAASVFAGSALFRASFGATFPLFVSQESLSCSHR